MVDARSKLDLLYQDVLGEVAEIVTRVEALQKGIPEATSALDKAGAMAGEVRDAVVQIPDVILKQTTAAGADLRGQVRAAGIELGQGITAAIQSAATSGAAALKKAAADLPAAAAANQDEIIKEWRAALANAARDEARGALARRMARSWGMVLMSLVLAAAIGAGGTLAAARLTGHLTPWAYPLMSTPAGAPDCGLIRGVGGAPMLVCLTR
ncbi:MAG: hypothetical protein ACYCXT_00090 [Acidiferrobacteraceae bacterium]